MACIQKTPWKGNGCKFYGAKGKIKDMSCSGWEVTGEERSDGVGIFVAEKWVDSVVNVKRRSKRALILKMILDNGLLNNLNIRMVYAPHSGKPEEEKENFWNDVFHLVSCIPQNEMVVLAGDMNRHVGSSNVGYDGTHDGFSYGDRKATRITNWNCQVTDGNISLQQHQQRWANRRVHNQESPRYHKR